MSTNGRTRARCPRGVRLRRKTPSDFPQMGHRWHPPVASGLAAQRANLAARLLARDAQGPGMACRAASGGRLAGKHAKNVPKIPLPPVVEISPPDVVKRQTVHWHGIASSTLTRGAIRDTAFR